MNRATSLWKEYVLQELDSLSRREPGSLYKSIIYALQGGGKQVRPRLLLQITEAFGGDIQTALPAAFGYELFHTFTLLHDDIMDKSPLRRGRETVYKKYSSNTAILSGDTMSILAYSYLLRLPQKYLHSTLKEFSQTATKVCEGQELDMLYEQESRVTMQQYKEMISLKTASLITSSVKVGAILSELPQKTQAALISYAFNLGVAFQICDDYLDTFGDTEKFGKQIGNDIIAGKKTYLYLHTLSRLDKQEIQAYKSLYEATPDKVKSEEKVHKVMGYFERTGTQAATQDTILNYRQQAMDALSSVKLSPMQENVLETIGEELTFRVK